MALGLTRGAICIASSLYRVKGLTLTPIASSLYRVKTLGFGLPLNPDIYPYRLDAIHIAPRPPRKVGARRQGTRRQRESFCDAAYNIYPCIVYRLDAIHIALHPPR